MLLPSVGPVFPLKLDFNLISFCQIESLAQWQRLGCIESNKRQLLLGKGVVRRGTARIERHTTGRHLVNSIHDEYAKCRLNCHLTRPCS